MKSKGLGDDIAKLTAVTKLNILAESIAKKLGKKDCGCSKRQEKLNKIFPNKWRNK